jgi:uncharacterized membrane protein HdeD (DUF308 family)
MEATSANPPTEEGQAGWGWYVAFGVALVVLGLIALWNAVDATLVTTVLVGFALAVGGAVEIAAAFMRGASLGRRILHVILGLLYLVVGFDLIVDPLRGTITLTLAVAILLIVDGAIRLWAAISQSMPQRWLVALFGVINIVFGFWLWTGIPMSGIAIGIYVGVALLMAGITWITAGLVSRSATSTA